MTEAKLSCATVTNLITIKSLKRSQILCAEGIDILGKRIAVAREEAATLRRIEKQCTNADIAAVYGSLAEQIENSLKEK